MKRFCIGIGILLLLLALGIGISASMDAIHTPIAHTLAQASEAALEDDWPRAIEYARQAEERWLRFHDFTAAFADHTPMDELDGLFAQLDSLSSQEETAHFAATCSQLSRLAHGMATSHSPTWWNIV